MSERRSLAATLAAGLGLLGAAGVGLGPLAAHTDLLSPFSGFRLFGFALLSGAVTLVLGLIGLARTTGERPGRGRAWLGLGLGLGLVAMLLVLALPARDLPRINDITTSPDDPPAFRAAAQLDANRGRDLSYPGEEFAVPQRAAYPDLEPIRLDDSPAAAFEAVRRAAGSLGWTIVAADPDAGRLEATHVSALFRFVDDVVVRVRPADGGSRIDVRSRSRDGRGDVGANAERIRAFRAALLRQG